MKKRNKGPNAGQPATPAAATSAPATDAAVIANAKPEQGVAEGAAAGPVVHVPSQITSTEENPSKSIVPPKYKTRYAAHGGTNGDNIAAALKALETPNAVGRPTLGLDTMKDVAAKNGIVFERYEKLNPGQQRMNLGNKLRGMVKAKKIVHIGAATIDQIQMVN